MFVPVVGVVLARFVVVTEVSVFSKAVLVWLFVPVLVWLFVPVPPSDTQLGEVVDGVMAAEVVGRSEFSLGVSVIHGARVCGVKVDSDPGAVGGGVRVAEFVDGSKVDSGAELLLGNDRLKWLKSCPQDRLLMPESLTVGIAILLTQKLFLSVFRWLFGQTCR